MGFSVPFQCMDIVLLGASMEVLQAGVKGPGLHRPENWRVRQLNDEPKPVYIKSRIY
jgi:hypothetical protein